MAWFSQSKGGGGTTDTTARAQASAAASKIDALYKVSGDKVKAKSTAFVVMSDGSIGQFSNPTGADIAVPSPATDADIIAAGFTKPTSSGKDSRLDNVYKVAGDKVKAGSEVFIITSTGAAVNYKNTTTGDLTVPDPASGASILAAGFSQLAATETSDQIIAVWQTKRTAWVADGGNVDFTTAEPSKIAGNAGKIYLNNKTGNGFNKDSLYELLSDLTWKEYKPSSGWTLSIGLDKFTFDGTVWKPDLKGDHLHVFVGDANTNTYYAFGKNKFWRNKVTTPNFTILPGQTGWPDNWEEVTQQTGLNYVNVVDNDTLVAKQYSVAEPTTNQVVHLTAPSASKNSWYTVVNTGAGIVDVGGIQVIGNGALEFTANEAGTSWVLTAKEGVTVVSGERTSKTFTKTAHGFKVGQAVYHDGTKFALADSTTEAKSEVVGIVSSVNSADSFDLCSEGYVQNIVQTGLSAGVVFLNGTPGNLTATAPTTGFLKAVMLLDSGTSGWVLHRPAFEIGATGTANNPSGLLVQPFGATFATLPTVPADASATIVYHTVLTADDIGTGTALAPQYQKGIYKSGANAAAGWTFETNFGGAGANTVLDAWLDSSDSNHATKGQISFQQVKDAILEEYQYFNTGTWDANNSPKAKNQYVAGSSGVDVSNFPYGLAKPAAFISEYYGDSSQGLQRLQIFGAPATSRGVWSRIYQGGTNWTPWQREGAFWEYTPDAATPGTEYYVIDGWVAINDGDLLKLNSTDTKTAVRAAPVSDWSNVPAITVSAAAKAAGWVIEGTQPLSGTQVIEFVPDTMFKKWLLRKSDSAVTTKTIHDLGNASAIALKSADNLAECHLEGGAGYSFNTADLADGLSFRLINTSTTDYTTAATFTGFDGVYERVGDTVVEITGITSFALKQNEWRDVTITKNGAFWYANIIGGLPDAVAVTTLTKAQVEDSADTSSGLVSGERLAQAIAKNVAPMTGSTGATDGVAGLVPKPLIADELKFLRGDGTWASTVVDITGQYLGSAGTFAGLPVIDAIGDPATNGDWAILSVADIGIGTAEAPEFERGVYVYDGTKFTFAVALSSDLSPLTQTQAESNTDTTPGLITGELLAQSISKNVKADLETLLGMPVSDKDLGTFAGDTIPDDSTIKAAFQALETKLETYKVTGRYIGSASTYSTLPTTSTATGSAINGDWVALNADDVGTGTAVAPQYPKGVYINDGTKYSFAFALAAALVNLTQAQAEDKASTVFGMVSGERLAQAVDKNLLKPYVHADKTTLAPAVPALPTITEVTNFCNAKTPKVRNQFIYYTNSDVATDTVLFAWYIDGNGLVKLIMDSRNNIIQNWTANSPVWPGCIRRFATPQIGGNVIHAVYKVTLPPGFTRASVDATELGNWDLVAQPSIGGWLSSTLFLINTRIINNNSIYRCQATHTSGTSFTFSESATNWSRDSATLPIFNVINNTVVIRGNSFYHLNSPSAITITIGANQFDLFMVKNTSGFAHTITPPAGETINGGANFVSSILNSSHIFTKVGTNWLTTQIDTPSTIRTGTLHDLSAATVIELDKVSNGLEAHFEGGLGYNINASSCNDGDIFYLLNTAGADQTNKLTFSNFAGAYLRNGTNESTITSPFTIGKGTKYIATVTVNGGSRFLNIVPLAGAALTQETYSGLQMVGQFTPPANTVYDSLATVTTGIDFTKCDLIEWQFCLTTAGDPRRISSFVPVVIGGTTPSMEVAHGSGQISSFIANATDAAAGIIKNVDCHGVAFETVKIRGWANGANGFVTPVGTTIAIKRKLTATGGLNTFKGASSADIYDNFPVPVQLDLSPNKQLGTVAPAANVSIINPLTGQILATATGADLAMTYTEIAAPAAFDFIEVDATADQTTGLTVGSPVLFSTPSIVGNIPFSNGVFTLSAGKTYTLMGDAAYINGTELITRWRDITNNALIGKSGNIGPGGRSTIAQASIKPATAITVQLEIVYVSALSGIYGNNVTTNGRGARAVIEQIASDNFVAPAGTLTYAPRSISGAGIAGTTGRDNTVTTIAITGIAAGSEVLQAGLSATGGATVVLVDSGRSGTAYVDVIPNGADTVITSTQTVWRRTLSATLNGSAVNINGGASSNVDATRSVSFWLAMPAGQRLNAAPTVTNGTLLSFEASGYGQLQPNNAGDIAVTAVSVAISPVAKGLSQANAGVAVAMGTILLRMPTSGNRSFQVQSNTGANLTLQAQNQHHAGGAGTGLVNITATPGGWTYFNAGWNFTAQGEWQSILINDQTSGRWYSVRGEVGASYNNCTFSWFEIV